MTVRGLVAFAGVIVTLSLNAGTAPGINRTVLLKLDSSIPGHEGTLATVDIAPGAAEGRHTHPTDVYGYVLEGTPSMEQAGSPTVTYHAGQAFYIPAGVVHQGMNISTAPAKVVVVFVAEKGRPASVPAP